MRLSVVVAGVLSGACMVLFGALVLFVVGRMIWSNTLPPMPLNQFCAPEQLTATHVRLRDDFQPDFKRVIMQIQVDVIALETIPRKTAFGVLHYFARYVLSAVTNLFYFATPIIDMFTTSISIHTFCSIQTFLSS